MSPRVQPSKTLVYIASLFAILLWGMSYIWTDRLIGQGIPIFYFVFVRIFMAGIILFLFNTAYARIKRIQKQDLGKFLLLAFFEPFIYFICETFGLKLTGSPTISAMVIATIPIFSIGAGIAFFKEKIKLGTWLCIAMATAGIGLLYKAPDGVTLSMAGVLLVLGSALAYTLYIIAINKTVLKETPSVKVTFYVILVGFLVFASTALFRGELHTPTKWYLWGDLLAFALLPTVISMLCATKAIVYVGSTATAILGALEPLTAVFFGVTLFGESLTARSVAGLLLIVISVTAVVTKKQ